jgi:hypothetical protein
MGVSKSIVRFLLFIFCHLVGAAAYIPKTPTQEGTVCVLVPAGDFLRVVAIEAAQRPISRIAFAPASPVD